MIIKIKDCFIKLQTNTIYDNPGLSDGIKNRVKNIPYLFFLISSVILSWGYFLTHEIICIDCLSNDRYSNGVLFGQNRITSPVISKILDLGSKGYPDFFFTNALGILFFILGIIILSTVLEKVYKPKTETPIILFSCIFISYPLMYEYFTFGGAMATGICTVFIALSLNLIASEKTVIKAFLIPSLLLFLTVSYYEAFLLPYITLTALILILTAKYGNGSQKQLFKTGIKFALPLVFGVIIKINTGFIVQAVLNVSDNFNADKGSNWIFGNFSTTLESIKIFFDTFVISWIAKAFCYTPITIIAVFVLIGIAVLIADIIRYKKPILILLYGIMYLSLFAFTLYRCKVMACRMEQAFPAFIASIVFIILLEFQKINRKNLYRVLVALFALLTLVQCASSSYWVHLENARYLEEKQVSVNIANDIRISYDISKPVAFVGEYKLSKSITDRVTMKDGSISKKICEHIYENDIQLVPGYKVCDTLARSYLAWGAGAFYDAGKENHKFFDYIGCPLVPCTQEQWEEARSLQASIPVYPNDGFIYDAGDYLIVNLG